MTETGISIIDPDSGECIDVSALTDRQIDRLHLLLRARETDYRLAARRVWDEIERRAKAQDGLTGDERRWVVRSERVKRAIPEMIREGVEG